jgi:hypothetical protein
MNQKLLENNERIEHAIGLILENALLKTGKSYHDKVSKKLQKEGLVFSDSYHKPEILKKILSKTYGKSQTALRKKVTKELLDFAAGKDATHFMTIINN